jgi:SAM-dependent methyltransferase
MSWRDRLIQRLRREAFVPSVLGIVVNPFHITRSALYHHVRELAPKVNGDVLDFGCGSKPYAELFSAAASYTGVDIAISGHDHRQSQVDHFYDGQTLPFEAQRYDAVVSFETLEHIFNPTRILCEINRVTRDGGQLLLSVPFVWDEHEVPYDFARYTSFGLRHVLESAGYEVLELRKSTTYVLTVAQMAIAYLHQHVFARRGVLRHLCQLLFIFPLSVTAYLLNAVLPRRDSFFCDCIVLARKTGAPRASIF